MKFFAAAKPASKTFSSRDVAWLLVLGCAVGVVMSAGVVFAIGLKRAFVGS